MGGMNLWFTEILYGFFQTSLRVRRVLAEEKSPYQHIAILDTDFFGRVLTLDNVIQLSERDNMGYHEMLTHVPMLAVENPRRVLIVGGGDGGTLQQVLRYPSVEEVVICELDRRVVELSREHFPFFGDPWSDPRVRLIIRDAFAFLQENPGQFDVILSDTTDPIGMAERLFSDEFYRLMVNSLTPGGAAATQCEQMFFDVKLIQRIYQTARKLVRHPAYYYAHVPSYPGGVIGFMYVSNVPWTNGLDKPYPPGENRYLNPQIHRAAFALPEFFRRALEEVEQAS
jgi:spermidine synthase